MQTIQKQFVPYEIALAMKELGFNEPCLGYFPNVENSDKTMIFFDRVPEYTINSLFDENPTNYHFTAPLWQQCVDWFREKYDLHVVITVNPYSEINEVNGFKIYDGNKELNCISNQETQTWSNYKAREQAILKCIELCKQKEQQ